MKSFYWFDYETVGTNPAADWPCQFAGIRTDEHFNEIGEPLNIYCQLPKDHLPHPEACLVTGLDPTEVNKKGLVEAEFIRRIHQELMVPGTCAVGYNSLRFDDEVTRHSLYRNFYDPYAREWQNGNSRWDLIDLVRLTAALRPEGINWPLHDNGDKSFKLEDLARANNLDHGNAHDALSDVRATIALARLIKSHQPKVYDFVFKQRGKHEAASLLNLSTQKPVVHVSGMFGPKKQNLSIVMPQVRHPVNNNGVIVYDLTVNPEPLMALSVAQIQERVFTAVDQLPDNSARIPLKVIHLNKCPVIAPLRVLKEDHHRLSLDIDVCRKHWTLLRAQQGLSKKVREVFASPPVKMTDDPDMMLYSGGFFSPADRRAMDQVVNTSPEELGQLELAFKDRRLEEMLFRYKARNYPDVLDGQEKEQWRQFCIHRLTQSGGERFGFQAFKEALMTSRTHHQSPEACRLLDKVERYVEEVRLLLRIESH